MSQLPQSYIDELVESKIKGLKKEKIRRVKQAEIEKQKLKRKRTIDSIDTLMRMAENEHSKIILCLQQIELSTESLELFLKRAKTERNESNSKIVCSAYEKRESEFKKHFEEENEKFEEFKKRFE